MTLSTFLAALGLAFNLGGVLIAQIEDQRVADLAAYSAALAYASTASTTTMVAAGQSLALLNGVTSNNITLALVTSPRNAANKAVQATVQSTEQTAFAAFLQAANLLTVASSAAVEISNANSSPPCVMALSQTGTGITLSGGTSISAPACSVVSNNTLTVPCGTSVTATVVTYDSTAAPTIGCSNVTGTITKTYTSDPFAGLSNVTSGTAMLPAAEAVTAPAPPSVSGGTSITFSTSAGSTAAQATAAGCSATLSGTTWTMNCTTASHTYNFGTITVDSSGATVIVNTVASSTYNFSGSLSISTYKTVTFGAGTYNIAQGIYVSTTSTLTMGAGAYNIGNNTNGCAFSICNGDVLVIGGPSTFSISNGISTTGGAKTTLGSGSTNSFQIGHTSGSSGDAILLGGLASLTLADATGSGDVFQVAGNIDASSGGSCLVLSAAPVHQVNGFFSSASGVNVGAGVWVVAQYLGFGINGGGDVTCNGSDLGLYANGVTFVIGGVASVSSQDCNSIPVIFCVAQGFSNITLVAPTTGATALMAVIGPTTTTDTAGGVFTQGATSTTISGAFYIPYGPLSLSGGANVSSPSGGCMTFIGSQITASGGANAATSCTGLGSSKTTLSVVQ